MIIYKGKLSIELEENVQELKDKIEQLEKLKEMILKSSTYKLLDGKTQMIDKRTENDIRSRQEHTNNVANISKRIIARIYDLCSIPRISKTETFKLNKKKAELEAEITALSHDLGHTPFGHSGESVVNEFMQSIADKEIISKIIDSRIKYFGREYEEEQGHIEGFTGKLSFEHNEQSAIEFYKIIEQGGDAFNKIDVRKMVKGILSHSISRVPEVPKDLVSQIVRQTDKIEYRNEDYREIAQYIRFRPGEEELQEYQALSTEERIEQIVEDISNEAIEKGIIDDENNALKRSKTLRKKYENIVYFTDTDGKRGLLTGNNREREQLIYKKLLEYYYQNPDRIPTKSFSYNHPINTEKEEERFVTFDKTRQTIETLPELVIKYLNTFTNEKCYEVYKRLVRERAISGTGHGIEPITQDEINERKRLQIEEQVAKQRAKDMYREREPRTYHEYRSIVQAKNRRFVENDLTEEGKAVIEKNRIAHQRENEEDKMLCEAVFEADEKWKKLHIIKELRQKRDARVRQEVRAKRRENIYARRTGRAGKAVGKAKLIKAKKQEERLQNKINKNSGFEGPEL